MLFNKMPVTMIPVSNSVNFRQEHVRKPSFLAENPGKWYEGRSSITAIIPCGGILTFMAGSGWKRQNLTTGYNHRITASTFLPFSDVFQQDPTRTLSPECWYFTFLTSTICFAIFSKRFIALPSSLSSSSTSLS